MLGKIIDTLIVLFTFASVLSAAYILSL